MNLRPLTSWLEDGAPVVHAELAEQRGETCAKCPMNRAGLWWEKFSKDPIANTIKKWLAIKNDMEIGVRAEKDLFMCDVCGCCVRLKIHEPLSYILRHTEQRTLDKFPPNCWIQTESSHYCNL